MDGALHGDPLEASALEAIRWDWNSTCHTARPRDLRRKSYDNASVNPNWKPREEQEQRADAEANAASKSVDVGGESFSSGPVGFDEVSVSVWRRHAFSSQLQRMSVVVQVAGIEGVTEESGVPEVCKYSCFCRIFVVCLR